MIHDIAEGKMRIINKLAAAALAAASRETKAIVDIENVKQAEKTAMLPRPQLNIPG